MTTDKSPEGAQDKALRLAHALDGGKLIDDSTEWADTLHASAAELRRLHARVQELERELVVESGRAAQLRLTVSNLDHQHAMQAAMNSEARNELAAIRARGARLPSAPLRSPACWCQACDVAANDGWPSRMSLCPSCGDKRCPRAEQHDNPCRARGAQGESNG